MIHYEKNCIHCGTPYYYQASGHGASKYNHSDYCPECYSVILEALAPIKLMYEWKSIDASNEVTLEQLLNVEKEEARRELKKKKKKGKYELHVRRVFPGLYDMSTGDSTHSRNITYNGVEYHLTEWNLSPEYNITRRVYWNLLTNKAHKGTGKESLERVTLIKPGIPYPPKREVKPCVPLQGPIGLAYALRTAYDRNDIINYELGFHGDMNVKIGD